MLWSDKAFGIYMGHAGEDAQAFVQEDAPIAARSFDDTQVVALARRDVPVYGSARTPSQLRDREAEGLAA